MLSKIRCKLLKTTPKVFQSKFLSSQEVIAREKKFVAHNYDSLPAALTRAKGIFVWDVDGKQYFDYLSGYSTNNYGHCHPKLVQTLREQSERLHHTSRAFHSDVLGEFASVITQKFGFDKVLPMNSGVEADEVAVKICRKWGYKVKKIPPNEAQIIFATDNYWGRSLAAISTSSDPNAYTNYGPFMPGFNCVPYDNLEALEEAFKDSRVCAFMVEPIQGEAGIVVPSLGYLKGVRDLCTKYNVLWIDDEVQTGLGRTGKNLAVDYENVRPDLLVFGKALGGGMYPISACLADDPVMLVMEPGTHGSTFGGNALGAKVAITSLQLMDELNVAENAFKLGEIFRNLLREKLDKDIAPEVRGKGLLNAVVIKDTIPAWDVCVKLIENGILAKDIHEKVIRFAPPLIITQEQLEESTEIIIKTINSIKV